MEKGAQPYVIKWMMGQKALAITAIYIQRNSFNNKKPVGYPAALFNSILSIIPLDGITSSVLFLIMLNDRI